MIAISSFRPRNKASDSIWMNQIKAASSWQMAFDGVVFMNRSDDGMVYGKTTFTNGDEKPSIKAMASIASLCPGWSCIINSDIVVIPKVSRLEFALEDNGAICGISKRWEIESKSLDNGIDFFCGTQKVWQEVVKEVPKEFTLGKVLWDNWMTNFFVKKFKHQCLDITPCQFFWHPRHEERIDQNFDVPQTEYLSENLWPTNQLIA